MGTGSGSSAHCFLSGFYGVGKEVFPPQFQMGFAVGGDVCFFCASFHSGHGVPLFSVLMFQLIYATLVGMWGRGIHEHGFL